jgi:hypothetical protein
MLTVVYVVFAAAHTALAIWALRLYRRRPSAGALVLMLPLFALVWDNGTVAVGSLVGEGALLQALTYPRFVGHAFLTPIWIVTAVAFATRVGAQGSRAALLSRGSWALYGLMVVLGVADALLLLRLEPARQADVLYYTNVGGLPGPPVPAIIMVLVTIACGALLFRAIRWPWMLAGAVFMLVTAAIPTDLVGFVVSNSGEVVLGMALVLTERRLQAIDAA